MLRRYLLDSYAALGKEAKGGPSQEPFDICLSLIKALSYSFIHVSARLSVSKMHWLQLALPCFDLLTSMSSSGSMMASSALLPSRGRGNLLECSPLFLIVEEQYGERVGTGETSSMIHE